MTDRGGEVDLTEEFNIEPGSQRKNLGPFEDHHPFPRALLTCAY